MDPDKERTISLFTESAKAGNVKSCVHLGNIHSGREGSGVLSDLNTIKALEFYGLAIKLVRRSCSPRAHLPRARPPVGRHARPTSADTHTHTRTHTHARTYTHTHTHTSARGASRGARAHLWQPQVGVDHSYARIH